MGSVTSIGPTKDLERFFDDLYGEQAGYAYSPTKDPESGAFNQFFFEWPAQREQLIQHVILRSSTHEVYHGVVLFRTPDNAERENILGTNYIWAEFDGELPSKDKNFPLPSLKIQSSTHGHEHWYWRLEGFITDIDVIENITKRLAYYLQADLSCWDANQVLRPPTTLHHESGKNTTIISSVPNTVSIAHFVGLPELPDKFSSVDDIPSIPDIVNVLMKYPWNNEQTDLFRARSQEKGARSSALTKLGHICIEMGMTNAEALSVLKNADDRWKKFTRRHNQLKCLLEIINYCRNQPQHSGTAPVSEEESAKSDPLFKFYTYEEFMQTEIELEWVLPGLLHQRGLMIISGPPKVGKSTFLMRMMEKLSKGEQFLKWKAERPLVNIFVSMEMGFVEVKYFYNIMKIPDNDLFKKKMIIMPMGKSMKLNSKIAQHKLNQIIETVQPDTIWFDSFGRGVGDDINSEKIVFETFDYIDGTIREEYGLAAGFIHHNRKAQIGNKKPTGLEDLYGNQYIGGAITSGMCLWEQKRGSGLIELSCLGVRLAPNFGTFMIHRTPGLEYEISETKIIPSDTPLFGGAPSSNGLVGASSNILGTSLGDTI